MMEIIVKKHSLIPFFLVSTLDHSIILNSFFHSFSVLFIANSVCGQNLGIIGRQVSSFEACAIMVRYS